MPSTSVRLDSDLDAKLALLASELDRSKSWIIIQALREYLGHAAAERHRWEQTREALESVSKGRVVPAEDVHTWLRSGASDSGTLLPRDSR
ncbi:MAG: ribbon-helix-helix protein, CopG family [Ignavibacteria bacterium]|nr:ribbon-helix-helix protein, CopG family [Ignavibacteria bacterium]MBP7094356.1 ribbon-helix-helix protein, CopG family [Candidatus Kapabacteria bacterium]MBK6417797.1 ribbon-helix-helix protein, CopG family [Ignavibacteria bacterium]MBK6760828.1 ribbon-helix-helix protein, CopG family [Ignavibacteria bacterium]MBK7031829.1 ribbon-helix-helix protein, CopG family [Ignavibacteria bacterium]